MARLLAKLKAHPKHASDARAFGYAIAGGEWVKTEAKASNEINAIELSIRESQGPIASRLFSDPLPGYGQYYAIVIGLPIIATAT